MNGIMSKSFYGAIDKSNAEKTESTPIAVVIRGKYDASGAMGISTQSLILQIAKTYRVAMRVIDDASNFGKNIDGACADFGKKASILIVMSHGRPSYLKFGDDHPWYKFGLTGKAVLKKKDIVQEDFSSLEAEAKIFLLSCSAGAEGGIARDFANASKRIVFAPTSFLYGIETCLQNWPSQDVRILSYSEDKHQNMGIFDPSLSSVTIPEINRISEETKKSFSEMEHYLSKKANEGDLDAQFELGSFFLRGLGAGEDLEYKGVRWILLAAEGGHAQAQYMMGYNCLSGQGGTEKTDFKALEWFRRSASQGAPLALLQMGMIFYHGSLGVLQSDDEAYEFFSKAAKTLTPQADYYLGFMYEYGRGVSRSLKEAKEHYRIAEEFGIADAKFRLANILFQEEQQLLGEDYYLKKASVVTKDFFEVLVEKASRVCSIARGCLFLEKEWRERIA